MRKFLSVFDHFKRYQKTSDAWKYTLSTVRDLYFFDSRNFWTRFLGTSFENPNRYAGLHLFLKHPPPDLFSAVIHKTFYTELYDPYKHQPIIPPLALSIQFSLITFDYD